jgi:hypothetical protein
VIRIPRTTLACVDCAHPALGSRALALSMRHCQYDEVKLLTYSPGGALRDIDPRIRVIAIETLASAREYSGFVMKRLASHVDTDFVQLVQWDGYVTRGEAWDDAFLGYDYIGARWWFHAASGCDVGNGGFSLRSRRLLEATRDDEVTVTDAEDDAICRVHRRLLEARYGIRFAPGEVADRYAFEGTKPTGAEFGFHGIYNLPRFLGEEALAELLDSVPEERFSGSSTVTLVHQCLQQFRGGPRRFGIIGIGGNKSRGELPSRPPEMGSVTPWLYMVFRLLPRAQSVAILRPAS